MVDFFFFPPTYSKHEKELRVNGVATITWLNVSNVNNGNGGRGNATGFERGHPRTIADYAIEVL